MTTLTFDEIWELLTTQDESQQLEVKVGSEVGKSCWDTISAFSNEPGVGAAILSLGLKRQRIPLAVSMKLKGFKQQIRFNLI